MSELPGLLRATAENFLIAFSSRSAVMVALLALEGPILLLGGDERFGLAVGGLVFMLHGAGFFLQARRNREGGLCLPALAAVLVAGFGVFLVLAAMVFALTGTRIELER